MRLFSLTELLDQSSDHAVSFAQDGQRRYWPEFKELARSICSKLVEQEESHWAIDIDDPFEFAAALIGTWSANKTAVIAPSSLLHARDSLPNIGGLIVAGGQPKWERPTLDIRCRSSAGQAPLRPAEHCRIALFTSGSTGQPKRIARTLMNMESELAVLHGLWTEHLENCTFHSTVSHRHIYGLLFRILWPLLTQRPFSGYDLSFPEQLQKANAETGILVASPALLKRIGHLNSATRGWSRVFSSGGLLSRQAASDSQRVLGTCPIEVFGSTETSGVAWRQQLGESNQDWTALPRVSIRTDQHSFLEVESPFTGMSGWLTMGDHVQINSKTSFELLGRGDHIAKIEDKRVSLSSIEQQLMKTYWIEDAAAIALTESDRQFVGAVLELSNDGEAELTRIGKRRFAENLRAKLDAIESVAVPKRFRYVKTMPVNAQGKRDATALRKLLEQ